MVLKIARETWCPKHTESVIMRENQRYSLEIKTGNVTSFQLFRNLCGDTLKGKFLDNPDLPYRKYTQIPWSLHVLQTTDSEIKSREWHILSLKPQPCRMGLSPRTEQEEALLKHNRTPSGYFTAEESWASNSLNS